MSRLSKTHPLLKIINSSLVDLPSPSSLTAMWNMGSLLGVCLGVQLISGLFLAMHFIAETSMAFESVSHISRDVNYGWLLRVIHANGASLFFMFLYLHVGRGIYFSSYQFVMTWSMGVVLLLLVMATAFMGYVLPWGQMSFWGATVITNLFSAVPYIGPDAVNWIWGGFAVGSATLTRFFVFHFTLPFAVAGGAAVHLLFLHQTGSSNPLGLSLNSDKVSFHPYFSSKDLLGVTFTMLAFLPFALLAPWLLGDPENFIPANPLVTPIHIQPEWYFLFAYAILRSIPNKLGGVIALAASVMILFFMPHLPIPKLSTMAWYFVNKSVFWLLVVVVLLLTWIGARPVEEPYILTGQILTILYFSYFLGSPLLQMLWENALK